jgi:20S proteasome subunit beta 4
MGTTDSPVDERLNMTIYRYHKPDGSLEEGLDVLRRAINETAQRLVIAPGNYTVKVVDKDGVREIKL